MLGLGPFGGVFIPSLLTIPGVIMYLRFGWVVGNGGLVGSALIVTISTAITFLTALSIATVATNQRIGIGGAYYMISRSLGIEIGGAVGIPLFLAQGLSVPLYNLGFAGSPIEASEIRMWGAVDANQTATAGFWENISVREVMT